MPGKHECSLDLRTVPSNAASEQLQPWQAKYSRQHLGLAYTEIHVLQLAQFASALDVYPSKSPPVNSTACKGLHVSLVAHGLSPLRGGDPEGSW